MVFHLIYLVMANNPSPRRCFNKGPIIFFHKSIILTLHCLNTNNMLGCLNISTRFTKFFSEISLFLRISYVVLEDIISKVSFKVKP